MLFYQEKQQGTSDRFPVPIGDASTIHPPVRNCVEDGIVTTPKKVKTMREIECLDIFYCTLPKTDKTEPENAWEREKHQPKYPNHQFGGSMLVFGRV